MLRKILILLILIVGIIFLTGCAQKNYTKEESDINSQTESSQYSVVRIKRIPDKIEVFHFHATQQCWACITVGQYALETIQQKFSEEYTSGKIIFRDINGELGENWPLVQKYQARGSSLFVNTIINGQDNIEEDVTVWRLVVNKNQFMNYFSNKLNNLLGR